ncbi:hypothetical protein PoHVEF18_008966 [Penicillium ochrochloron]
MIPHGARQALRRINERAMNEDDQADIKEEAPEHLLSAWDALRVRGFLQWRLGVPVEIVDQIIDTAEYWPSTTATMAPPEEGTHRIIRKDRDQVLLKTVPLCYDRKGPGRINENMYEHSWTWFDAEVIRGAHEKKMYVDGEEQVLLDNEKGETAIPREPDDPLLLPTEHKVQVNGARVSEVQDVEIVWDSEDNVQPDSPAALDIEQTKGRGRATLDGRFVREMQVGDSIALWARARFPGWSNHVYRASVTVYWAV